MIETIGIIGLGSFGNFVASRVPNKIKVFGYETHVSTKHQRVILSDLGTIAKCDVVILAIPLKSYPLVLKELSQLLHPDTLVIDTCSVKTVPCQLFDKYLTKHHNILMTHPLFGPQSAAKSMKGHRLIVTHKSGSKANGVLNYCKNKLGLEVQQMPATKHDQIMARVHVLTFFIARGLSSMPRQKDVFITPSYRMLIDLIKFDHDHSDDLFSTIQNGNPYAKKIRRQLIDALSRIDKNLEDNSIRSKKV